jgi:2-polyprenyl-3-methyl-5-hydroxy-6-metoxy-1,4-benzoquinol methylase
MSLLVRTVEYEVERPELEHHIPRDARRILDLGCCTGTLGAALKRRQDATVLGVEIDQTYAAAAQTRLDRVVVSDVEQFLRGPVPAEAPFDCLIAADVLEHLVDPWLALARAADLLSPGATVVLSLPNVLHYRGIWQLLRSGRWPREEVGVFDRTHLQWFTLDDGLDLLRQAGLRPTDIDPRYWAAGWHLRWRQQLAKTPLRRFLPVQYVFRAIKDTRPRNVSA